MILLSSKPYNPAVALRQIHEVLELRKMWSVEWLMRKGMKKERDSGEGESDQDGKERNLAVIGQPTEWNRDPLMPDSTTSGSSTTAPDLDSLGNVPISPKTPFFARGENKGNQLGVVQFSMHRYWDQEHTIPDWSPEKFPSTLSDFQQWWNVLSKQDYKGIFPRTIFDDGRCFTVGGATLLELVEQPKASDVIDKVDLDLEVSGKSVKYYGDGRFGMCRFPVRRFVFVDISQQLLKNQFDNWRVGSFDASFPDLAQAAHDLATLELDDIEKFVAGEAAAKGTEVFEAFGMKFPAGQITIWGIIILLGIQLYFFIYLKQLSGKLGPSDAGWDVPWIGMTASPLARIIFFFTITLLPLMATVLLGTLTIDHFEKPMIWNRWTISIVLGLASALVSTLILGTLSWRYRPMLREAPSPLDSHLEQDPETGSEAMTSNPQTKQPHE